MAYCPSCGAQLIEGARFCTNCGAQVALTAQNTVSPYATVSYADTSRNDYRIILVDRGKCTKTNAKELLMDIFGYTTTEANAILNSLPAEIACNLSFKQAVYACQALNEYGLELSVLNNDGYTDIDSYASAPVYDNNGSFLSGVLSILGTLTAANRLTSFSRWSYPVRKSFRPAYRPAAPTVYVRHPVHPAPAVRKVTVAKKAPPRPNPVPRQNAPVRDAISPLNRNAPRPASSRRNDDRRGPDPKGGMGPGGRR